MKKDKILKIIKERSDYLKIHRSAVYQDIDGMINEIKGMLVALSDDDDVAVPEIFTSDAKLANCEQTEVIKTFVELSSAVKAVATQKSLKADAYSDAYQTVRGGLDHPILTFLRWALIVLFGLSAVVLIVASFMKLSGKDIEWLPFPIEWLPEVVGIVDLSFGVAFFIIEQISDMRDKKGAKEADKKIEDADKKVNIKINGNGNIVNYGDRAKNTIHNYVSLGSDYKGDRE